MILTGWQRDELELYRACRNETQPMLPYLRKLLKRRWPVLATLLPFLFVAWYDSPTHFWMVVGVLMGLLLGGFAGMASFSYRWPAVRSVIDWQQLDRLLAENRSVGAQGRAQSARHRTL